MIPKSIEKTCAPSDSPGTFWLIVAGLEPSVVVALEGLELVVDAIIVDCGGGRGRGKDFT